MLWSPQLYRPAPQRIVAAAAAATTWNNADKDSGTTLDGTFLVATNASGAASGVRSAGSISGTDKKYWEVVLTVDASDGTGVGIANGTWDLTTTPVGTTNAAACRSGDGFIFINFGTIVGVAASASGDNIGFAVDYANKKIWSRLNGGSWDNTTDNPATNTGGGDFSAVTGAVYALAWTSQFNNAITAKFSSAAWVYAAPSGFSQVT